MKKLKRWLCFALALAMLGTTCLSDYTTAYASSPVKVETVAPADNEAEKPSDSAAAKPAENGAAGVGNAETPDAPEASGNGNESGSAKPDASTTPSEDTEGAGEGEDGKPSGSETGQAGELPAEELPQEDKEAPYANYLFGDPDYDDNYVYGEDADGNELLEKYVNDLDTIITLAEEGMDLSSFFRGTIFRGFTLEDLYSMRNDGYSFDEIIYLYLTGSEDIPDWLGVALYENGPGWMAATQAGEGLPNTLTGQNWQPMSQHVLDIVRCLGGDKRHGKIGKLKATGDDGMSYEVFCLSYGGSYQGGYIYNRVEYSECNAPNGAAFTSSQKEMLQCLVNAYLFKTNKTSFDYSATQLLMWYIINNVQSKGELNADKIVEDLSSTIRAINGDSPLANSSSIFGDGGYIGQFIRLAVMMIKSSDAATIAGGSPVEVYFWKSGSAPTAQNILSWSGDMPTLDFAAIPYIDNHYMERTATTRYKVEVTKESILTNELLEGFQFEVVESEASGHDLTYDIIKGEYSEDGQDYENATTNPGSFGNTTTESDPVPYLDDDVEPSGGQHRTTITTDENGHADTTFVHTHTFKEFYSQCYAMPGTEIDYAQYQKLWASALKQAQLEPLGIMISYMGKTQMMTLAQIQKIYDAQQVVYTQTEAEATDTINSLYDAYCARTHTYTVTELDTYTRPGSTDSNGNVLDEIRLPHAGYRKDVQDATTIGSYVEVVKNGGTMVAGGKNDQDGNTEEVNVTNEPWYNQIFINKTDLETNSQILYDTAFDIYEYYQYKVTLSPATQKLYPAKYLTQYMADVGGKLLPGNIKSAKLVVTNSGDKEVLNQELDVAKLTAALSDTDSYTVDFSTTYSGDYTVDLRLTLDNELDFSTALKKEVYNGSLVEIGTCTCTDGCTEDCDDTCPVCAISKDYCGSFDGTVTVYSLTSKDEVRQEKKITSWDNDNDTFTTEDGITYKATATGDGEDKVVTYTYTDAEGVERTLTDKDNSAVIDTTYDSTGAVSGYVFSYIGDSDTGIYIFSDGTTMKGLDDNYKYVKVEEADGTYTLYFYVNSLLENGEYSYKTNFSVSPASISGKTIDRNVNTDPDDYTTWGQANYEIVRVTADIAKQMGWSDTTIGMYTVHRLSPTDQYCGTTFTDHHDESNKDYKYGYREYGTLYYTQANQGKFAIVEKTAPADSSLTGYLGNYEDRDYTKLDDQSSKKNNDGAPYATADQMSTVKMVHYIDLCKDTNQYATYMLTDGFKEYDAEKYTRYIESVKDDRGNDVPTGDGYDAHYFDQSSLKETIALERYKLESPLNDVLNQFWDNWFSEYLSRNSGLTVTRNSQKTDTWLKEKEQKDILHHYVGTTINKDSFDDNDASQSDITYDGTYTHTNINYNSYAGERAEALNQREGFNSREYLQVGGVTYDNAAQEKDARYFNTEASVNKDEGYAFIDEREYGYIRFTKYDMDADRYVTGDLDEGYEAGTDHADADLDGAVYSLYVDESNLFTVDYLEGTLNDKLFWAQPIKSGGYRIIWDGDDNADNGFQDKGDNAYEDYEHAYLTKDMVLHLDYTDDDAGEAAVTKNTATYHGIQHPDGQYGGPKHNGFFAVLEEQQVFLDLNNDGYSDTWTLEDVTLYAGAKVASAPIENGELEIDGLYLGTYYLAEEIRDAITIYSTDNDDVEYAENRWLSFAPGYTADTDDSGNPKKYTFRFPYVGKTVDDVDYKAEQDYVHKNTEQVSLQKVVRGGSAQFNKITTNGESSSSGNTTGEALEGAGFKVYLLSELSLIVDGTVAPAYSEVDGHELVEAGSLVKLFDAAGNMVGYEFTKGYLKDHDLYSYFDAKYPDGYNLADVNRLIYVKDRGYYYIEDILAAYRNQYYDNNTKKWDFSGEERAIARIYSNDADYISNINKDFAYVDNHLNSGSPCEWYGVNGLSEGWVATDTKYEYKLSEIFSNHYGSLRVPELSWGAYIMVETSTPKDVFTADPVFFTITDSSASLNRSKKVTITDTSIVASLVLIKRDAQSGQDVKQAGTSYRIWDYKNNQYVSKYILGANGALSMVSQRVFKTDADGRINAVASLECGKYRIEELSGPNGYHNVYWDYGNGTEGEELGGLGKDNEVKTEDNMFQKYYGTMDFEVTTERLYKSSGIVSSDNLDYLYIGENYYNDEVQGKLNITKTGEVLVGYKNTDDIEYSDEYTDSSENGFNYSKSMMRERSVFESMKDYYDLGTDEIQSREIAIDGLKVDSITPVSHIAINAAGMNLAAVYTEADGTLKTMNGGTVYQTGACVTAEDGSKTYYPAATVETPADTYVYTMDGGETYLLATKTVDNTVPETPVEKYFDAKGAEITDVEVLGTMAAAAIITKMDGETVNAPADSTAEITEADAVLMIVYDLSTDIYEHAELREAEDMYIYSVKGDIMDTSYLVTDKEGTLTTNDHGTLTLQANGTYTLTYTEAIYDPDKNYNYILTYGDGHTKKVKLITGDMYLSEDNEIVRALDNGGYSVENAEGKVTEYADATVTLGEKNTGSTFDFVYEERRLAGATYVIRAAEDIATQDGGDNYWFKKGDVVATVTTANDGEIVDFAPVYNQGGSYDSTYYYGANNGSSSSLTKGNNYEASKFTTSGAVKNQWIASRMSSLDLSLFGIPAFTDDTIYPNTYYREEVQPIYRRIIKEGVNADTVLTDYQSRLEAHAGLDSEGCEILTATPDGFRLTNQESIEYKGAKLVDNADYYLLKGKGRSGEDIDIEVRESDTLYRITENLDASKPWAAGDYVEKTASGYKIVHTDAFEAGVNHGSTVDGAADLGYTTTAYYPNATLYDNGGNTYTLYDENMAEVVKMEAGILVTEAGGIVTKTANGYRVDYEKAEDITANKYVTPSLKIKGAELVIKDQTYDLSWDSDSQSFKTSHDTTIAFADDYSSVTVTTGGKDMTYKAFDLEIEYELHYAQKENIVEVEKDGTLGMVSLYLPLGKYEVQEIETPYGFVINDQVQTVEFSNVDQVKEVVFNTAAESTDYTDKTMDIWTSKGLKWFVGGLNTIGEKLTQITGVNFFTWGTYGDAELPFFADKNGFLNFFDLRVKAWSQEETPGPKPADKLVTISKKDITSLKELPGAKLTVTDEEGNTIDSWTSTSKPHELIGLKDGKYTLTEITAPDGYDKAESITFEVKDGVTTAGTVVMYDAPDEKGVRISKQDITTGKELPGANLVVTDSEGNAVDSWVSGRKPHVIENLKDGKYTLTEITAPDGYTKTESITFTVKDGVAFGGDVVMFDQPEGNKVYISKRDLTTKDELPGAKLRLEKDGKTVDSWTSTDTPHVMENLEDGDYTLTEVTAPAGYEKAESITITIKNGVSVGGPVVMYDRVSDVPKEPSDDRHPESEENQWKLGVGIYKADKDTGASLKGAKFGLYTSDDIYNVDGKLIVTKGTLLATATTDKTGHANFAVDIALMSKDLDAARADHDLVYEKTIQYKYDSLTQVSDNIYLLSVSDCDDVTLVKQADGTFKTETGSVCTIDTAAKTVTYTVKESIDGNTAVNTGKFHIKELTPPDGYLYDDTVYDVKFEYDNDTTMYIPVYAKHKNEPTKVTLNKMDLTGQEEVPGAQIAVYKIKDIKDVNADGMISHEDDNLILVDKWVSTDTAHETTGLLLSNTEWPRLTNQELRENIYIFREVVPADGYVRAQDIEFKLLQKQGADGWINSATGEPYGYDVLTRVVNCNEDYLSGSIISPNEHADSWILNGTATESTWDYTKALDGETVAKWLLVNKNLVLFFSENTNQETIAKTLKEADFADLDFDTVYLEFGGKKFDVDFFTDKQVGTRPADSYLHYDQSAWYVLDDIHVTMYDDTTKLAFKKQDIVTGEDVVGAKLTITDEKGNVIDSWTVEADENGNVTDHDIEGKLAIEKEYTLTETYAPTDKGYVKSNSVKFRVDDNGHIQKVVMQDDFTKLEISKADINTGKEIDGAVMEIWSADAKGNRKALVERWTTGQDGYDKKGYPNRHYIDYLPVGNYILVEAAVPAGYLAAEDIAFSVTETGLLQKVQMLDATTNLKVYKYRTGTTEFVPGATIQIYEVPEKYIKYLTDRITVETDAGMLTDAEGFTPATEEKGSSDLSEYLSAVTAEGTEHRKTYETTLTMKYSILAEDLKDNLTFTQALPEEITVPDSSLGAEVVVKDGENKAFSYILSKDGNSTKITLTFDKDYVEAAGHDSFDFYMTFGATIADAALRANGKLVVKFTDSLTLTVKPEEIKEIGSNVTEPTTTIKLTKDDLRATVKTTDGPVSVPGLNAGWYIALETSAPNGYILDSTPQVFHLDNITAEQALTFYNEAVKKPQGGGGGGHHSPGRPVIGKLVLRFGNGFRWNNVRTEDNGEAGSSILLEIDNSSTKTFPAMIILAVIEIVLAAGVVVLIIVYRKKKKEMEEKK